MAEGRSEQEVLDITKYAVSTARGLITRYHRLGLAGLRDGRHDNAGAPTVLSAEEQQRVAARLQTDFEQGVVWEGKKLQAWIKQAFGKDVYLSRTYEFMRAAGLSPQKPRPHHVSADAERQEAFKTKS